MKQKAEERGEQIHHTIRRRRGKHEIILQILKLAKDGIKKTKLMIDANLSYGQLKRYLRALNEAELIIEESKGWRTTEKGLHVIEACELCQRLIQEVHG